MKIKKGFVLRDVCGEKVVMGEGLEVVDFRHLVSLNETAAFLWQQAVESEEFTTGQLTDALLKEYDVERSVAQADVERTVGEWIRAGVAEA